MNCYIHTYKPAVTTCPECGMGLCRDCVDNAVYTLDNKPLCHDCSLKTADKELSEAKSRKVWSLVKMIFGACFLVLGISIYYSTGDLMNAWIYAGIAGIPAAFKSTRSSRRQKLRNDLDDALAPGITDLAFNWVIRLIVRLALIICFAPIMATFSVFKNLFVFIGSTSDIRKAQEAYDHLVSEHDIVLESPDVVQPSDTGYLSNAEVSAPFAHPAPMQDDTSPLVQTRNDLYDGVSENRNTGSREEQKFVAGTQTERATAPIVHTSKKNSTVVISIVAGIVLAVIGALAYFLWYAPYAKDRDAPRTYVVANNVFLRSTQMAGVEYNIVGKIPYGSEVITYSKLGEWAEVKVNGQKGFIASAYLLDPQYFNYLNYIWGDLDTRECIESSKCRLAILDYFMNNKLTSGANGWQVFTRPINQKPNTVFYPRLYDKYSKYTDFVFIIKDNQTGNRVLVCYSFEDTTEKPIFRFSVDAPPTGYIKSVTPRSGGARVVFDDNSYLNITL